MTVESITAGVDWLTATLTEDDPNAVALVRRGHEMLMRIRDDGHVLDNRGLMGYEGYSCGNCFVGQREAGTIVILCSKWADQFYYEVTALRPKIARIDVQVTVRYSEMPLDVARRAYIAGRRSAEQEPVHRRRKLLLISGSDGADTCYVGSPSSEQRSRIYNKEKQSEDPNYSCTWRWEVTLRNKHAQVVHELLAAVPVRYRELCASVVLSWHKERGILPDWHEFSSEMLLPVPHTKPTDIQAKLNWLEQQVAPTIRYLTERGYLDTIYLLLGLTRPE